MKVYELLEQLKDVNPDSEVIQYDPDEYNYYKPVLHKFKNAVVLAHYYGDSYNFENDELKIFGIENGSEPRWFEDDKRDKL